MASRGGLGAVLLAIGAVGSVIGAGAWWLSPGRASFYTDDGAIRATTDGAPLRDVMWRPPELLGESLATPVDEADPESGGAGEVVYFSRPGASGDADLFAAQRLGDGWDEARPLSVNTLDNESGPAVSRDGDWLYFSSDRPGSIGGLDLWRAPIVGGRLGDAEPLGPGVNSGHDELAPAFGAGASRGTLYFSSNRPGESGTTGENPGGGFDLYAVATGAGDGVKPDPGAVRLDVLNSASDDLSPAVSPAGDFVYFSSDRPGGAGGFDLYRARIRAGGVDAPEVLGLDVNTAADELEPSLAMEGFALLFASDRSDGERAGGQTDLYRAISREVYLARDAQRGIWAELLALVPWLLAALALVLLLALLRRLIADVSWQGRIATLGLMARCVLLSMVVHAGVMAALAMMQVKPESGVRTAEGGAVRVSLASSGVRASVSSQLRGAPAPSDVARASVESSAAPAMAVRSPSPESAAFRPDTSRRAPDRVAVSASVGEAQPASAGARVEAPPVDETAVRLAEGALRTPAAGRAERVLEADATGVAAASVLGEQTSSPAITGSARVETRSFEPDGAAQTMVSDAVGVEAVPVGTVTGPAQRPATATDAGTALPDLSSGDVLASVATPAASIAADTAREQAFEIGGGLPSNGVGLPVASATARGTARGMGRVVLDLEPTGERGEQGGVDLAGVGDLMSSEGAVASPRMIDEGVEVPDMLALGDPVFSTPGSGSAPDDGDTEESSIGDTRVAHADSGAPIGPSARGIGGAAPTATHEIDGSSGTRLADEIGLPERGVTPLASSGAPAADVAIPELSTFGEPAFSLPTLAPEPRLVGRVFDAKTGEAIAGASVRLDLERADDAVVETDGDGRFGLRFGDIPDNAALTASHPGYTPSAVNIAEADLAGGGRIEIGLSPIDPNVIAFEMEPVVHHLGNDEFSGRINSQFQRAAEGTRLSMPFEFPADRAALGVAGAEIRLLTKGSQLENRVLLNGQRIGVLAESPGDGSFGEQAIRVPLELLRPGRNEVEFRSVRRQDTDIDDFEFVNVRLVLVMKKRAVY